MCRWGEKSLTLHLLFFFIKVHSKLAKKILTLQFSKRLRLSCSNLTRVSCVFSFSCWSSYRDLQKYMTAELRRKGMYGIHDGQEEGVVYSWSNGRDSAPGKVFLRCYWWNTFSQKFLFLPRSTDCCGKVITWAINLSRKS